MQRTDKRNFDQLREISITPTFNIHAEGSALTKFGNTHVICNATIEKARKRAMKWVRNWIKQKLVGKSKNLADISIGQKVALDKKVDQKVKMMGAKVKAMVKKQTRAQIKKHRDRKKQLQAAEK